MVNATLIRYFILMVNAVAGPEYGVSQHLNANYHEAYTASGLRHIINTPPKNLNRHYLLNLKIKSGVTLHAHSFDNLQNLEILNLVVETQLPDGIFLPLTSLKCLTLYAPKTIRVNKHLFSGLKQLEHLQLIKNVSKFPSHFFDVLQRLQTLDLSWNQIQYAHKLFQIDLNNLRVLRLTGNRIRALKLLTHLPNLKNLNLSRNLIATIDQSAFRNLTQLNTLDLSGNCLHTLHVSFPNLLTLDLRHNNISVITNVPDLTTLLLSHNNLPNLTFLVNPYKLYLQHNNLTILQQNFFEKASRLRVLSLSHNRLIELQLVFDRLRKLTHLDLSSNFITFLERNSLTELYNLQYLNLSRNLLTSLDRIVFSRNAKLRSLDLSYNRIDVLPPGVFVSLDVLWYLHLDHNRLHSLSPFGFLRLRNLWELNLSFNFIRVVNKMAFAGLKQLGRLRLHNNRLDEVDDGVFCGLVHLKVLTLYDNGFDCIDYEVFKHLKMADVVLDSGVLDCKINDRQ